MADENGKWITINGTHVFLKDGETPEQALAKLQDKPKREKYYKVLTRHPYLGTNSYIVPESELDKYKKIDNLDKIEELHLESQLEFIDGLDYNENIRLLENKLFRETVGLSIAEKRFIKNEFYKKLAEHQQKLADDFLSDIPKSKDNMVEETVQNINQNHYQWSKEQPPESSDYAAYTYNCQRCAQAFILRWCHGYDVEAKPSERIWDSKKRKFVLTGVDSELDKYAISNGYDRIGQYTDFHSEYNGWDRVIFNERDVRKTLTNGASIAEKIGYSGTEDQLRWIKRTVKEAGPGAAYLCSVCWKGTRRDDGTYDAHVFCIINDKGKVKCVDPQTGEECSRYFTDKQIVPSKTEIFRADTCRLNGTMMKELVTYE